MPIEYKSQLTHNTLGLNQLAIFILECQIEFGV